MEKPQFNDLCKNVHEQLSPYNALKEMIDYPSFSDLGKYSPEQFSIVNNMITYSEDIGKANEEIKAVLEYHNKEFGSKFTFIDFKQWLEDMKKGIDRRFYHPQLIEYIHQQLDRTHKLDHKEKLAVFIISLSAELPNPDDHVSAALKGDSSSGKDSVIKTCFSLFPKKDNFRLTRATTAVLEDECHRVKRIAFSEINKEREGANSEITETFKQLAEGGLNVLKKDKETNCKTTKHIEIEQKTLLYGTTETANDDELVTRYVIIPIRGYEVKNKCVVDDTLDKSSNVGYYLTKLEDSTNWVNTSIERLDHDIQVIIPFASIFKNKILDEDKEEKYLFDYRKERIKRDSKRLLSLTRAIAWLYQKQRKQFTAEGKNFLYAEPSDFTLALEIFAEFFNLTYSGLDHRLIKCLDCIKSNMGKHAGEILKHGFDLEYSDWVLRDKIQKEMAIESRNTIKGYIAKLTDLGRIESYYNDSVTNKAFLVRPVNEPVSNLSLPISLTAIDRCLTGWMIANKTYDKEIISISLNFLRRITPKNSTLSGELTGQKLTGQSSGSVYRKNDKLIVTEEKVE